MFVCFVLCCAEKEEGETGVTYFKLFWVGTTVIEINYIPMMGKGWPLGVIKGLRRTKSVF